MTLVDERQRVLEFLEQQLFGPVLDQKPDDYPPFRRDEVEEVRGIVRRERQAISNRPSANDVVLAFREAARRSAETGLEARLRGLDFPTFGELRDELEKLAAELGVPGQPGPPGFPG